MDAERWARIQALFHRLVEFDPSAREPLLKEATQGDAELEAALRSLLESDSRSSEILGRVDEPAVRVPPDPLLGSELGPLRLVERLGAGGMGIVYRAERRDGLFDSEVAVKLIRVELATPWLLARFDRERRTLARLQHPSIARLLDGGATSSGTPYFVMELIQGEALMRYVERCRLGIDGRLDLFLEIAAAVRYAHQRMVIHCDLKPSNILVDREGRAHLLDFGIARLLEDAPEDRPAGSPGTLQAVLTPEYASPEQLAGLPLTTAVDVYALGVILYELLTGERPLATPSRSIVDWERLVREREPPRASSRFESAEEPDTLERSRSLSGSPGALRRRLRGDLDRILAVALRKEPERRYSSVEALIEDLDRHRRGLPIVARGSAFGYRAGRFLLRYRWPVSAAMALVLGLAYGFQSARRAERVAIAGALRARLESSSFQNLSGFLMDAFLPVGPQQDADFQARARESLEAHAERIERQYIGEPLVAANLYLALGDVAERLALWDLGEPWIERACELRRAAFGAKSLEVGNALLTLGRYRYQAGDPTRAEPALREALEIERALASNPDSNPAAAAAGLGACLRSLGRYDEALELQLEALALRKADAPGLPTAESLNNLAVLYRDLGRTAEGLLALEEATRIRLEVLGPGHQLTLQSLSNLAGLRFENGDLAAAALDFERARAGYEALGSDGELGLSSVLTSLGAIHLWSGQPGEAEAPLRQALELAERRLEPLHPGIADRLEALAKALHGQRRLEEAKTLWGRALDIRRAHPGEGRALCESLYARGMFLCSKGDLDEAEADFVEAQQVLSQVASSIPILDGRLFAGRAYRAQEAGAIESARVLWTRALAILEHCPEASAAELTRARKGATKQDSR